MGERQPPPPFQEAAPGEILKHGALLVALRLQHDWSQKDLARESGLSQGYICELEKADEPDPSRKPINPSYKSIIALARAFGTGINFWEGQVDQRTFLRPEARLVNDMLQSPHLSDSSPIQPLLSQRIAIIPEASDPYLIYIEHVPTYHLIGEKIKSIRLARGLFQWQVAGKAQVTQGYYSQLENTQSKKPVKNPQFNHMTGFARALKIDIHDLLDLKKVTYPDLVVKVDRFFRSDQIPPELKKRVLSAITALYDLLTNPILNPSGQKSPAPAQ